MNFKKRGGGNTVPFLFLNFCTMRQVFPIGLLICLLVPGAGRTQPGQISIARIEKMPAMPSPYLMRNWKQVAETYDQLVFSTTPSGQYLPLLSSKPSGTNYPDVSPILLPSYVGSNSTSQAEAINILPALVGASLLNINKANQNGTDWVAKAKEFFNRANGENVYLNGYSANSGGDWWYDVMPNIFFYQLYALYPGQSDFAGQFRSVADQWLKAVHAMGGSNTPWAVPQMNYRGWRLISMTGNSDGVKEPEAAGGIAWLLYHAYKKTGIKKYLHGAQMCLDFLTTLTSNPSYELQLPYGAFVAARINAELGTHYPVEKLINWTFDRGPLRGWGAIVGKWDGVDVHGLIGEANDAGNDYAFVMNGFQQAAALVPLVKYDKRYARTIAKWTLNLANASRFFYPGYVAPNRQDDFSWSNLYDPQSAIAYEALREKNAFNNNLPRYATGDAKRNNWANTNLSLYSSSSVGYLAALLDTTNVPGILKLDLNKTDFFSAGSPSSWLLYNPYSIAKQVTLTLGPGVFDVYDALQETVIQSGASGTIQIPLPADQAAVLVLVPGGSVLKEQNGKLLAGTAIVDYHYKDNFLPSPRIKSIAATDTLVEFNQSVQVYVTTDQLADDASYTWFENNAQIATAPAAVFNWKAPAVAGRSVLRLEILSAGKKIRDSIVFNVVQFIPSPPEIKNILANARWYSSGGNAILTCEAADKKDSPDALKYEWAVTAGSLLAATGKSVTWKLPSQEGIFEISCKVTDSENLTTLEKKRILIKSPGTGMAPALIYFPFDGDTRDYSGNDFHATSSGVEAITDARGQPDKAFQFNSGQDIIQLANRPALNFQDKITISCWLNLSELSEEAFAISHGSWEERWKISVIPSKKIRWTIKTDKGIRDLDSSLPIHLNQFYHVTAVYSGYSMELYINGMLDSFLAHTGSVQTSGKSLTIGRKDENTTRYSWTGILDEIKIFQTGLLPGQIDSLRMQWHEAITAAHAAEAVVSIFPNPAGDKLFIQGARVDSPGRVELFHAAGGRVDVPVANEDERVVLSVQGLAPGFYVVRIPTSVGLICRKVIIR